MIRSFHIKISLKAFMAGCLVCVFLITCFTEINSDVLIYETKLNGETNPIGIDVDTPVFSWQLKSDERNRYQSAYQIIVLSGNTKDTCWNSRKILSDNNLLVKYSGIPLKPVNSYTWKVRIWDNEGKSSPWSNENNFSTGLMSENDWKAEWISTPGNFYSPVFIKEFSIEKIPELANVFVNCQGYFELYINGVKVGKDVLSPAVSDFRFENYYLTYDIQNYLKSGKNAIGLWTGTGWYSYGLPGVIHHAPVFRLQAHLSSDRNSDVIISDTTWMTSNSNIRQIGTWRWNKMGGELVDGRISMSEWNKGEKGKNRENAIRIAKPDALTKSQICRTNIISDTIPVKDVLHIGKNAWMIDFGKNFTGWMRMKIKKQNPGDTIDYIYSDFCNKKPERISRYEWDFGNTHDWESGNTWINQIDAYICSDSDSGLFCPKFNYHTFRYVIIQGLKYIPQAGDISGFMIESNLTEAGSFSSSDKDLNAIHELNHYTFRCLDIGGYYVDCPHRERLGYGDGQVAVETGIYNFELGNFYKKWALNWISAQNAEGEFPNTAPSPYNAGGGPAWGGAGIVIPWKIFKYYGDTALLSYSYNSMVAYVEFLESKSKDGLLVHYGDETWGFIGDWVSPGKGMDSEDKVGKTEKEVFNNCYKVYLYDIIAECAEVLDKTNDNEKYKNQSATLKNNIHKRYYNVEKGIYANGEQSYLSFPLFMNVPPKNDRNSVLTKLENDIRITQNGHLNTGMLGTYFMLQYLTNIGRSDLVYLIMKQKTYPGWGFMISQGANTCWEQWNGFWSQVHSCYTSGGGWFYTGVAGIRQVENSVAFKHLLIVPQLTDKISEQKTQFNSPYGKVLVSWTHKNNSGLQILIEIPVNTKADVILPVSGNEVVYESAKKLSENDEIQLLSKDPGNLRVSITSGKYIFDIIKK